MRALSKVHGAVVQDIIYMAKKALLVEGAWKYKQTKQEINELRLGSSM
jgi:hypothetical protein